MLTLRMNLIMKIAQGEHEHDMNGSEVGIMQSQLVLVQCLQGQWTKNLIVEFFYTSCFGLFILKCYL